MAKKMEEKRDDDESVYLDCFKVRTSEIHAPQIITESENWDVT